ncbi:helix-turn-helix transcriptional regulator [Clostridioides sp. ZZV15-6597]|uniref:helix-turn-helix domain-containing protein n=1 Tax=Clostridioides sp. ZZV15-6597 TaxID=2811500 RepID=UPI001D110DE0|nr:helix-turn-helix transcriptional regulator [Clostridioides sp. ZZV15-6597]
MADTEKKTINKDINFRIKKVRKNLGFTQKEFAKKLGLSQNHLSYIERGERKVFQNLINAIFIEFGVNREWLKTGEGNVYDSAESTTRHMLYNDNSDNDDVTFLYGDLDKKLSEKFGKDFVEIINDFYEILQESKKEKE